MRDVQEFKVVFIRLHFRGAEGLEAHVCQDVQDLAHVLISRMQTSGVRTAAGERDVQFFAFEGSSQCLLVKNRVAGFQCLFQSLTDLVRRLSQFRTVFFGGFFHFAEDLLYEGSLSQPRCFPLCEAAFICDTFECSQRFLFEVLQL